MRSFYKLFDIFSAIKTNITVSSTFQNKISKEEEKVERWIEEAKNHPEKWNLL